ncbi:hypothetical protein C3R19_25050, partial [Blautia producta]
DELSAAYALACKFSAPVRAGKPAARFGVRVYIPSNRQSTQHYLPYKKHHAACVFHGEVIKFSTITSAVQYNINHDPTGIEWEKRRGE